MIDKANADQDGSEADEGAEGPSVRFRTDGPSAHKAHRIVDGHQFTIFVTCGTVMDHRGFIGVVLRGALGDGFVKGDLRRLGGELARSVTSALDSATITLRRVVGKGAMDMRALWLKRSMTRPGRSALLRRKERMS